jgi:tetratricopeptide (TPR) repeat protein
MKLRDFGDDKAFKNAVTVFLAGLTLVGSLIVVLNLTASQRGAAAGRDSRILGIRYLTHLSRALWDAAAEKRLMVAWQELGGLMLQSEAYEKMTAGKNASLYRITRERLAKIRDLLASQGELSRAPYFDASAAAFDFLQYYLDKTYVPAAELLERQALKKSEGAFWGTKNDAYTTALAVMTVAVFLLTLSLVLSGKARTFMAVGGFLLIFSVVAVVASTAGRGWKTPPEGSVALLAEASAKVMRAQLILSTGNDLAAAADLAGQAGADLEKILADDPDYESALLLRNRVLSLQGETGVFGGKVEESRRDLAGAVDGIKKAIAGGREDGYLYWAQSNDEYFLGENDAALKAAEMALATLPERAFAIGALKSLALLAGGKKAESGAAMEAAITHALEHPLASDPADFRTLIKNLERLNEVRPIDGAPAVIGRLKEAAVCIAVLKKTHPEVIASKVTALEFVSPRYDRRWEVTDLPKCEAFPRSSARAHFLVDFKGMKKDASVVTKVYSKAPGRVFWVEQFRLEKAQHWTGSDSARILGSVEYPMPEAGEVLSSGDYRLEIYLGGNLSASGTFKVL